MLNEVADGVFVHESTFCQSNAVVVQGDAGVLLIDAGVNTDELAGLARDIAALGQPVVAGFSTHPHWDHMLWHADLGAPPRYATALCAATAELRLAAGIDPKRVGIPDDVSLDLMGLLTGLRTGTTHVPWAGPAVRIVEHSAHAPGHAALLIEHGGVLVAGDMLSDVFIPMLDLRDSEDPIGDYLAALDLIEGSAGDAELVVPGHGSVGNSDELSARLEQDRAYIQSVRAGLQPNDPRIGPDAKPGWEWVVTVHDRQMEQLAAKN